MLSVSLRRAGHIRHYSVRSSAIAGWEISLEEDRALRRRVRYHDWHRVERQLALLEREIAELAAEGWEVQPAQ